jgi:beta-glucosidase
MKACARSGCGLYSVATIALLGTLVCSVPAQTAPAFRNPTLPIEQRVQDLVQVMSLEEKVSQLSHTSDAIPRLGIPEYNWWNEGLHGVARAGVATVFPQAIGSAATFDEPLVHDIASTIGTEFRAKYNATVAKDGTSLWYHGLTPWSPNINIFRDPRWGRGQETYGEDPFLTSRMGVAFVTGLQGDDPKYLKTVATPKHFAVHSGPESTRHEVNVQVSRHDLEDTYLPAFRAAITEGKAASIMCAYNSLDGEPACASDLLLNEHLRKDWGFKGYVVSDCGAIDDVFHGHHFTPTIEAAVTASIQRGTDLICGEPPQDRVKYERTAILNAVHSGQLSEATIDTAVKRLLTARFRLGMFDPPGSVPFEHIPPSENDSEGHRRLALRAARESLVLLKNDNHLLPLSKIYPSIAVIGPNADSLDSLVGNYNGTPSHPVTVLAGIRSRFPHSQIHYVQGSGLVGPVVRPVPESVLFTDASHATHGLKAEYFRGISLTGAVAMHRVDKTINFAWGFSGVSPQLAQNYSVRWTGVVVPAETADYVVGFTGQDGYRVWIDDQLVLEDWSTHRPATTVTKQIPLKQGHAYKIKIEYFQTVRGAEARLQWGIPGTEEKAALDAAKRADLVVLVMGLSGRVEGEEMKMHADGFAGGDRTAIDLPKPQENLLEKISSFGKPTVLVLMNGSPLSVNWAQDHVGAIIEAWYPGESGGEAVASALAGDFSPAGRLPVTFYRSAGQLPPFDDYSMENRTYRYFKGDVLYPFGYGLSFTAFAYSNAIVKPVEDAAEGDITIAADVANSGNMAGDEVVQLYLTQNSVPGTPLRSLEGYRRVHLNRGEKQTVSFHLNSRNLSVVDQQGVRRLIPGTVHAWIGGGQPSGTSSAQPATGVGIDFHLNATGVLPN